MFVFCLQNVVFPLHTDDEFATESKLFLYTEVMSHVCNCCQWLPDLVMDPVDILLLDLTCNVVDLQSVCAANKHLYRVYQQNVQTVRDCVRQIVNPGTRDMIVKKLDSLSENEI